MPRGDRDHRNDVYERALRTLPLSLRVAVERPEGGVTWLRRGIRTPGPGRHAPADPRGADGGLRVLHVAEAFGGGLLEMVRIVAERASSAGQQHAIAYGVRPETPDDPRAVVAADVELFPLHWDSRRPLADLAAGWALRRLVATWQPDVVHLHSSFAAVVGSIALSGRVRLIYTPHSLASEQINRSALSRHVFRIVERGVAAVADAVGAVSQSEADALRRLGATRVEVIPNGIPELDGEPPGAEAGEVPLRVIASGRMVAQRRPQACARILAAVADEADVAWIGGGGNEAGDGRGVLEAAGVPVSGWVSRERSLQEMRRATVYLHFTAADGLPLSVLEAMACDAIVVASDVPASRELLDPRQLCRSEGEAVALIRRLLHDPGLRAELLVAQAARRPRYSARVMAEAWQRLYAALVANPYRSP